MSWARLGFRIRILLLLVVGSTAVAGALPGDASAARAELQLRGSHGYKVKIVGKGGRVTLRAFGPKGDVEYRVPGRVTRNEISARFGRLGKVKMMFRPGQRAIIETPPRRCEGEPRSTRWGRFVGVVRFSGERGFTRVRARRAAGNVHVPTPWNCRRRERQARMASGDQRIDLAASASGPVLLELLDSRERVEVAAVTTRGGAYALTLFVASTRERRGRMQIERSALEFGPPRSFTFNESLTEATLTPPPSAFTGKGIFDSDPAPASWTGSLSLALPGMERISLTAPRFRARLEREPDRLGGGSGGG